MSATRADVRLLLVLLAVTGRPLPRRCGNPACGKVLQRRPGRSGYEGGRGLCGTCYGRSRRAGFPREVPAAPGQSAAQAARLTAAAIAVRAAKQRRTDRYAAARLQGAGPHAAAARVGIRRPATVRQYEAEFRQAQDQRREGREASAA